MPRPGRPRTRLLSAVLTLLALVGCTATPQPVTPSASGGTPPGASGMAATPSPSATSSVGGGEVFAQLPRMLLWEPGDAGTRLRRTEPGRPDRWSELAVPAGWDYAAAPDSAEVVAVRGREIAFGRAGAEFYCPAL